MCNQECLLPCEWVSERASERANDWADQRINVDGLGWLIADLIVGLRYCPETGLLYASVTVHSGYLHTGTERVPANAFLCMTLSLRRYVMLPSFYVINAPWDRATALPLSSLVKFPETIIVNYYERKKRSCPLVFLPVLSDKLLIRLVTLWNVLYCMEEEWVFNTFYTYIYRHTYVCTNIYEYIYYTHAYSYI